MWGRGGAIGAAAPRPSGRIHSAPAATVPPPATWGEGPAHTRRVHPQTWDGFRAAVLEARVHTARHPPAGTGKPRYSHLLARQGGARTIHSHTGQQMRHRGNEARHGKPRLYRGGSRHTASMPSGHVGRPRDAGGGAGRGEGRPGFCSHGLGSMSPGAAAQLRAPPCMAVTLRESRAGWGEGRGTAHCGPGTNSGAFPSSSGLPISSGHLLKGAGPSVLRLLPALLGPSKRVWGVGWGGQQHSALPSRLASCGPRGHNRSGGMRTEREDPAARGHGAGPGRGTAESRWGAVSHGQISQARAGRWPAPIGLPAPKDLHAPLRDVVFQWSPHRGL